ncbi:MAG TPA: MFS transporter [Myxococcota bacterium]
MPPIAETKRLAALGEPDFRWFLASRFCSATAMTGLRTAIAWHVFALTGSPFALGLLGAVQFAPALGLSLVGGAFADAHDRRRIAQVTQAIAVAGAALLAAASVLGGASAPLLFAVVFVVALAAAFENPARAALLPLVVSRERFVAAVPVHSTAQAFALMSGPALAGVAIGAAGVAAAYAGIAALSLGAIAGLGRIRPRHPDGERRQVSLRAIREGVAYVRGQPVLLGCMTLDMFAVIFAGASALLPVYAQEILRVGPWGFGVLSASLEAGALAMSVLLMVRRPIRGQGRALLAAVAVFGLATIAFGLSRSFWLSVAIYVLVGMADQVSVVMRSTIVQLTTPDELRGRVSSINMIFIGASNQVGAMESGFVAALTSATFSVVSGGVASLAVAALVAARVPALRRYRAG